MRSIVRSTFILCLLLLLPPRLKPLQAQTIDDGIMLGRRELLVGGFYTYDSWDQYWEGALKRRNDNIGAITTQTSVWSANFGLANRLNIIGAVPYVWTKASQGVLHGIEGLQDVTLAVKWSALEAPLANGVFRAIAVVAGGGPLTDYNPELPPLSIGSGSTRLSWRGTADFQTRPGWFLTGSFAYTWRSDVELDRPYYFTDDEFVMSNEVEMPNAIDYSGMGGYMKRGLMLAASLSQQRTLGGGDIRRQDMPIVSNRMNFLKAGGMVVYPIPTARALAVQFALAHTFDGRNVGQSTTFTTGVRYTFNGAPTP